MPRSLLRSLPALAVLALAACDGDSTHSEDTFVANRALARIQRDETREELKLDVPVLAMQVVSVLDPARATTVVVGGTFDDLDDTRASPMLELYIPGALKPGSYPIGVLDPASYELPSADETSVFGLLAASRSSGATPSLFATTGGSVEVVSVEPATGRLPGHLRARMNLELREFSLDEDVFGFGGGATGRGTVDGLMLQSPASDAEVAFTGAYTGATERDLLSSSFSQYAGSPRDWLFLTRAGSLEGGIGTLDLHLARVPVAGETLRFSPVFPDVLRSSPPADSVSAAVLEVFGATGMQAYLSTSGQLRVESATAEAVRGTLTLTLTETDRATGRRGTRTVTASGRVGFALTSASPFLNRSSAHRAALLRSRR